MNYEQLRAKIGGAVLAALPVDSDDGTCVVRFDGPSDTPVWGPPEAVVEAIVNEVMQVLFPDPVPLPLVADSRDAPQLYEPDSCPDGEGCIFFVLRHAHPVPAPQQLQGDPRRTGRWACGCTTKECDLLWVTGRDSSADPSQVLRVTCTTHGIFGDSEPARVAANEGMRQRAQALYKLDLAHAEQCR